MALAIFLATGVTMQAQDRLTQYKVRNAISVRTPIMNDSINPKGEKHTKKMLLQTPVVLHLPDAPMQSLTADTAGYLSFEKADKDNKLYLVKTQIRAERFLKGKLKITSPVRWEVFIDGASKQVKDAAEDSITSGSSRDIALSLEPERDYEIIIKLLSASDDKAAPTLKCELIKDEKFKDTACNLDPEAKKRFSLDNTVYGNRAIAVSISPSGKYLLTRYWDNHAAKRSRTYCELTELKNGKVLLTNLRDGMSWMPKSDKLYYTVTALTGNDVITLDPATLREETILQSIPEQSFRWSPNEDFLIYYPREEGVKEDGPLRRIVSPADRIPNSRGRSFLAKYNLADGVS
ncbi:S9 family peptidase, partial [Bacteroides thetaiotaomicron]